MATDIFSDLCTAALTDPEETEESAGLLPVQNRIAC